MRTTYDPLGRRFAELEAERQSLLNAMAHHDPILLETPPGPDAWSVAQVVLHLTIAEEGALAYLRKKMQFGGHERLFIAGSLRLIALHLALSLPVRWKAPKMIADVPWTPWPEALTRWGHVRRDWERTLAGLSPELARHDLFKHPVVGKLSLVQGLRFMGRHVRHHRAQIDRTLP